jgi:hypothetical protein
MDPKVLETAENVLYNIWYSVAEKVVNKAITIYELDDKQSDALKKV